MFFIFSVKELVVFIKGGLGNQMFQYAFAKSLESNFNKEVKLFPIDLKYSEKNTKHTRNLELKSFNISLEFIDKNELEKFYWRNDKCLAFNNNFNPKIRFFKRLKTWIPKLYRPESYRFYVQEDINMIDYPNKYINGGAINGGGGGIYSLN